MTNNRRDFMKLSVFGTIIAVSFYTVGCGIEPDAKKPNESGEKPEEPAPKKKKKSGEAKGDGGTDQQTPASDITGEISANHAHEIVLKGEVIDAGENVTLNIRGASDHDHFIVLTPADLQKIIAGEQVKVLSDGDDTVFHTHEVVFSASV